MNTTNKKPTDGQPAMVVQGINCVQFVHVMGVTLYQSKLYDAQVLVAVCYSTLRDVQVTLTSFYYELYDPQVGVALCYPKLVS